MGSFQDQHPRLKPFLRWPGGKSKIANILARFLPPSNSYNRYIEPFVGAGALFFYVGAANAILSDLNEDLINCYRQVADHPCKVWNSLQKYRKLDSKEFYYSIRSQRAEYLNLTEQAARFIYLNKAAFNGIYRVNKRGEFNVPYGPSFRGLALPPKDLLTVASSLLKKANLLSADYREICDRAKPRDFVYLDPPYPPTNGTAYFTHYTANRFSWYDQEEVSKVFRYLDKKGCLVMMSNADRKKIRSMFCGYFIRRLSVTRWLGCNGDRFKVYEVVITNYPVQTPTRGFRHKWQ